MAVWAWLSSCALKACEARAIYCRLFRHSLFLHLYRNCTPVWHAYACRFGGCFNGLFLHVSDSQCATLLRWVYLI